LLLYFCAQAFTCLDCGVGTLVGFLGGAVGKVIIAVTMIVIFLAQVI
jgi:uncharacterized protein YqgC (DUF456 family)